MSFITGDCINILNGDMYDAKSIAVSPGGLNIIFASRDKSVKIPHFYTWQHLKGF